MFSYILFNWNISHCKSNISQSKAGGVRRDPATFRRWSRCSNCLTKSLVCQPTSTFWNITLLPLYLKDCVLTVTININQDKPCYPFMSPLKYISQNKNSKSYKVKLDEWGANPLLSDYEADMLTIWLKAQAASQAASSLPILIGILHITMVCFYMIYRYAFSEWRSTSMTSQWPLIMT